MFICPQPGKWHEIYEMLKTAWQKAGAIGSKPPVPLILAGWNYSNDVEKKIRWEDMLDWAKEQNFLHLIPELSAEESYFVDEPSNYQISPMGSPMFLDWNFTQRNTPTEQEVNQAIKILKEKWSEIVGKDLGAITVPLRITGKRKRRLLVFANHDSEPSWGTWFELANDNRRRAFTYFRRAINDTISPLHVDHIEFEVDRGN